MAQVPSGLKNYVASAFAAAKTVSAVSNAAEAVVSSTAHGYSNGDIVEITSGWGRLNRRAFRIKSVAADAFTLEGCDTSNTTFFPPGSGIGTCRKVTTWQEITRVLTSTSNGGDAKKVPYKYLDDDVERELNDGFTAISRTMELDADVIEDPCYAVLKGLTDVQSDTILKSVTKKGTTTYLPCCLAMNDEETYQDGQINKIRIAISGNGRSVRYAAA